MCAFLRNDTPLESPATARRIAYTIFCLRQHSCKLWPRIHRRSVTCRDQFFVRIPHANQAVQIHAYRNIDTSYSLVDQGIRHDLHCLKCSAAQSLGLPFNRPKGNIHTNDNLGTHFTHRDDRQRFG